MPKDKNLGVCLAVKDVLRVLGVLVAEGVKTVLALAKLWVSWVLCVTLRVWVAD